MKMIVIGGSAGSLEPIETILSDLPDTLDAAVLVLRHSAPVRAGRMDGLLTRMLVPHCRLPVCEVMDDMPVLAGQVYVAPAGTHVHVVAADDAREPVRSGDARFVLEAADGSLKGRPSIDLALASAADVFADDCIGVVLSGFLDDGTEGAQELASEFGTMIVQSPSDADQPSMPNNVIARDHPDYILPDVQIAQTLVSLVNGVMVGSDLAALSARQSR